MRMSCKRGTTSCTATSLGVKVSHSLVLGLRQPDDFFSIPSVAEHWPQYSRQARGQPRGDLSSPQQVGLLADPAEHHAQQPRWHVR